MRNVVAMVLAGGRVSELDVLTINRPKSAVPFGGLYRVIDFPLSNLMYSGIERVGVLSQYRPFSLMHHIGSGEAWDLYGRNRSIHFLPPFKGHNPTDWYRGTADAVYQNLDYIQRMKAEYVLVLSGDHIYRMDYSQLLAFHKERRADVTIAFLQVEEEQASRFGLGRIDAEHKLGGRLLDYAEKPKAPISNWASMTVYLFNYRVLLEILDELVGDKCMSEFGRDILPAILDAYSVYGYKFNGYWGYTRTIAEYYRTNMSLLGDNPVIDPDTWQVRTNLANRNIRDRAPAYVHPRSQISNSLFYNGCRIYGTVQNSILYPGVIVEPGAVVQNSIIIFDSVVKEQARVRCAIVDSDALIGREARIGLSGVTGMVSLMDIAQEDLVLIGQRAVVPDGAHLSPGDRVHPNSYSARRTALRMQERGEIAA